MKVPFSKLKSYLPQTFFGVVLGFIVLYICIASIQHPTDYTGDVKYCQAYNQMYSTESGQHADNQFPYYAKNEAGQTKSLYAQVPSDISDRTAILLRPDQLDIKVYIDDELRLDYSTQTSRLFGKVSPRHYICLMVDSEDAGKEMCIETTTNVDKSGSFNIMSYGDRYDITRDLIRESTGDILIALVMLIVCILCLVGGIILSIFLHSFVEITHLSIMGILASIWILCNAEASQFYFSNVSTAMNVDYFMLMMLPFPFLFFMDSIQKKKFHVVYKIFECVAILNTLICILLFVAQKVDLSQMFIYIAGVFGSAFIMILVTMAIDILRDKNYSYTIIAFGIFSGIFAALVQAGLFLLGYYSIGGSIVAFSLLIILATSIIDTAIKVQKIEAERQMAIAKGQAESSFLANMSHEIRTPINAVIGLNEMILRESSEPEILDYAKHIDNSGKMLLAIINDILDISKIRSGKMHIVEDHYQLNTLIEEVCAMIRNKAQDKNLAFHVDVDETLPNQLIGDEVRIKQVLINILNNAVKYTEKGSVNFKITSKSRDDIKSTGDSKNSDGSKSADNNTTWDDQEIVLCFEVKDTGQGIKKEDQESLFDAFTRVDEKNNKHIEGTGLGLALVKNLTDSMNGELILDSEYGVGSTFAVLLPQKVTGEETIKQAAEKKSTVTNIENNQALVIAPDAKILVVDDVPVNLMVVGSLLKRTKVKVSKANSGMDCINLLKEDNFDLILLDHLMPEMDGIETLKKIKKEKLANGTPIIALTANAVSEAKNEYISAGFDDYLSKPVIGKDLEEMLLKYLPSDKIQNED